MSTWTCSRSATWTFVFYARRGGRFARRRTPSEGRETRSRTRRTPPRTPPPAPSPSSPWTNASPSSTRSSGEGKVPTGRVPTGRAPTGRVPTGRGSTGRVPTGCPSMGTPSTGYPRSVECPPRRDTLGTPTRCTPRPKQRRPPPSDSPPSSSTRTPARHPRRALRDRERRTLYSLDAPTTTRGTNVENPTIDPFDSARRISPRAPYFAPCSGTESTRRCSSSRVASNRRPIPPTAATAAPTFPSEIARWRRRTRRRRPRDERWWPPRENTWATTRRRTKPRTSSSAPPSAPRSPR